LVAQRCIASHDTTTTMMTTLVVACCFGGCRAVLDLSINIFSREIFITF
jgi:hypothetical protein